jgi:dTMP kinase
LSGEEDRWGPQAEALLFAAARTDHVDKVIRPAVDQGQWVLSDRFIDSSLAYQGAAGGLGVERVRSINLFGIDGMLPDRTMILHLDNGIDRALARDTGVTDRIGGRPLSYHQDVEAAFRNIANDEPDRVRLVDASGTPGEVTQRLLAEIQDLL